MGCWVQCTAALDLNVPGQPPGQLQIFMSGGRLAASCGFPKLDCQICYDSTLNAWRWDGTAVWKLLFLSAASGKRFEGHLQISALLLARLLSPLLVLSA